jgi:hypothetical protein
MWEFIGLKVVALGSSSATKEAKRQQRDQERGTKEITSSKAGRMEQQRQGARAAARGKTAGQKLKIYRF